MTHHYTAIIVKSGEWFAGTIKELSGVHTQGKTIDEVKENLREAIAMVIESNLKHFGISATIFPERSSVWDVAIQPALG